MSFKIEEKYTPEMEDKDILVFLKTNFFTVGTTKHGKKCAIPDKSNYVYGFFPKRKATKGGTSCESYVKPEGDILTWKDKLNKGSTLELDALSEDIPASWEEYSDLLAELVRTHKVGDDTIVIEDATTWQKLNAARKRFLRKQMEEVVKFNESRNVARQGQVYPLAYAG